MSAYPPPNENLPIFNPVDFQVPNIPLTINDAKDYFLEYPTAQGKETLSSIDVNGASVFNDTATHNDLVIVNQPTSSLNGIEITTDNPGYSLTATSRTNPGTAGKLTITGSSSVNKENPIVADTDSVISTSINGQDDTGNLCLTGKSSTNGNGIRILAGSGVYNYGPFKLLQGPGNQNAEIVFSDLTTQTTAFNSSLYAPINSPVFTGVPEAPTPTQGDNSTKLATTNYVDTAVGGGGSVHYTYSELFTNGSSGTSVSITIPANCIRCDVMTFGRGGSAGQTNVYGSYAVNGGSGGGASMVCAYGVPINSGSTLDLYWTSGTTSSGIAYVMLNNALPLGSAYNGGDGGAGTGGGTGAKGIGATQVATQPKFPSSSFDGTDGQDGGSSGFPNSNIPNGGSNPVNVGKQQTIGGSQGGPGIGQKYSAFNDPSVSPSFYYNASPHLNAGSCRITWYITQ